MTSKSSKIFFFDVGGVLLSNGWGHESRQAAAVHFGYDYEKTDLLHNFIFNVYEIGSITLDEYLDRTVFVESRNFSKKDFKDFMFAQSTELPDTLQWLKQWKRENAKHAVISINNEGKELNDYRIKKFELHDFFDAFISSCEVKMRKPDPAIFKLALGIAQADPKDCVYFDDRPMLVHAAQQLGIQAYHHEGFLSTKNILEKILQENG